MKISIYYINRGIFKYIFYKYFKQDILNEYLKLKIRKENRIKRLKKVKNESMKFCDLPLKLKSRRFCKTLGLKYNPESLSLIYLIIITDIENFKSIEKKFPL